MKLKLKIVSMIAALFMIMGVTACSSGNSDSDSSSSSSGGSGGIPGYPSSGGVTESTSDDWLVLFYADADNNLIGDILNDVVNMSWGLSKTTSGTKIMTLFDGIDDSEITNESIKDNLKNTRLIELKKAPDGYGSTSEEFFNNFKTNSELSFASITGTDYTSQVSWISNNEANMASAETLQNFLDFAADTYFGTDKMNPKHVILIVSDHGSGASSTNASTSEILSRNVCSDETNGGETDIGTDKFGNAVRNSKLKGKIGIIHFDLCLTADFETAYEVCDLTNYIVASPNLSTGCPWDDLIQNLSKDKSEADFAKEIVTKTSLSRSVNIDNLENGKTNANTNYADKKYAKYCNSEHNSPTYSAFDASKIQAVYDSLEKVINVFAAGAGIGGSTYTSKFLTYAKSGSKCDITLPLDTWLSADGTNTPHPIDYLFAEDYSYACPRGIHGWIKKESDTQTPGGRMTTMFYIGSYANLIDLGYLMKMYVEDSGLTADAYKDVVVAENVTNAQFIELCKNVQTALKAAIIESHRCDSTKSVPESLSNLSDNNFYTELDSANPTYFGITIGSTACVDPDKGVINSCGGKVTDSGSMWYKYSCKFVKDTKWCDVLDAIFTEKNGFTVSASKGYTSDCHDPLYSTLNQ